LPIIFESVFCFLQSLHVSVTSHGKPKGRRPWCDCQVHQKRSVPQGNPKIDLAVGGKIYHDYLNKCEDRIGGRSLTDQNYNDYMKALWTTGMTKHLQKNALAAKRSAVYTVMQNTFSGKCCSSLRLLVLFLVDVHDHVLHKF
jgi:hypothetical protein